ncbi:MAG: hypothetical protein GX375_09330 [Clostridiales bacterium]|nr:hypothetical protein [Clostridiales bacterium]
MPVDSGNNFNSKVSDVVVGFDILLEIIKDTLIATNKAGARAMNLGNYNLANKYIDHGRKIKDFENEIEILKNTWLSICSPHQKTNEETKQTDGSHRKNFGRLPRGVRTPESAFIKPILEVLIELGGSAPMAKVLDLVKLKVEGQLQEVDYQPLPSDPKIIRWRNTAQWARQDLVTKGFLKNDSPRGIWEISDKGRQLILDRRP